MTATDGAWTPNNGWCVQVARTRNGSTSWDTLTTRCRWHSEAMAYRIAEARVALCCRGDGSGEESVRVLSPDGVVRRRWDVAVTAGDA